MGTDHGWVELPSEAVDEATDWSWLTTPGSGVECGARVGRCDETNAKAQVLRQHRDCPRGRSSKSLHGSFQPGVRHASEAVCTLRSRMESDMGMSV